MPALEAAVARRRTIARDAAAQAVEQFARDADAGAGRGVGRAEREAREAARAADAAPRRSNGWRRSAPALAERHADLEPVLRPRAKSLTAAETALAALPDPAALSRIDEAARARAAARQAVADKRAEAATRARETAADRERHARRGASRASGAGARPMPRRGSAKRPSASRAGRRAPANSPTSRTGWTSRSSEFEGDSRAKPARSRRGRAAEEQAAKRRWREMAAQLAEAGEAFAAARETPRRRRRPRRGAGSPPRRVCAGICGEQFECPPPLLPEKARLRRRRARRCRDGSGSARPADRRARADRPGQSGRRAGACRARRQPRQPGAAERDELTQAINRLRGSIGSLNREGRVRLLDAYEQVDRHFRSLFTTLFDGGQAHLELVESDDPLEAGLEIMAQPPGKRLSR